MDADQIMLETFHRTLRDILKTENKENSKKAFGDKVVVLEGDLGKFCLL